MVVTICLVRSYPLFISFQRSCDLSNTRDNLALYKVRHLKDLHQLNMVLKHLKHPNVYEARLAKYFENLPTVCLAARFLPALPPTPARRPRRTRSPTPVHLFVFCSENASYHADLRSQGPSEYQKAWVFTPLTSWIRAREQSRVGIGGAMYVEWLSRFSVCWNCKNSLSSPLMCRSSEGWSLLCSYSQGK